MIICSKNMPKNSQHDHQKPSTKKVYWLSLFVDYQCVRRGMPIKPSKFLNSNKNKK